MQTGVPGALWINTLKLPAWLKTEAAKSRKQRRTLKQLHLELRASGYEGAYDWVAAFARRWKVGQLERGNSARKSTHYIENRQISKLRLMPSGSYGSLGLA